jgi:hypothetical protein
LPVRAGAVRVEEAAAAGALSGRAEPAPCAGVEVAAAVASREGAISGASLGGSAATGGSFAGAAMGGVPSVASGEAAPDGRSCGLGSPPSARHPAKSAPPRTEAATPSARAVTDALRRGLASTPASS